MIDVCFDAFPVLVPYVLDVLDPVSALQLLGDADFLLQTCQLGLDLLYYLCHIQLVLHKKSKVYNLIRRKRIIILQIKNVALRF